MKVTSSTVLCQNTTTNKKQFCFAHKILEKSAEDYGSFEAVRLGDRFLTYRELNDRSGKIADCLLRAGVNIGDRIGIYIEKSLDFVISIFAVLKSGGVYVPMDPRNHVKRNEFIINDSNISIILTTSSTVYEVKNIRKIGNSREKIILIDEKSPHLDKLSKDDNIFDYHEIIKQKPKEVPIDISPQDLAVIFYTSGSTGTPKGVMISHESIVVFVNWVIDEFQITSKDRFISIAPMHFDISLLDIFASLAVGASVVLVPPSKVGNPGFIISLVVQEQITFWQSVPSVLILLVEYGEFEKLNLNRIRHVIFTGEKMPVKYLKVLIQYFKEADFYNIYGCTETNDTFMYRVPKDVNMIPSPLPIGKALPYVNFHIIDENNCDVGFDKEGELIVSAPTIMKGYQKEAGNNENLVSFRSSEGKVKKYFRTRDLVVQSKSKGLTLCGRTDDIIKTNGNRVNLLEVQTCIQSHPDIIESGVFSVDDDFIGKRIVAIVLKRQEIPLRSYGS